MKREKLEALKQIREDVPAERRLVLLRHELLRYLPTIQAFALLLREVNWASVEGIPKNINIIRITEHLAQLSDDANQTLEILAGPQDKG